MNRAWEEIYSSHYPRLVTLMTALCGSVSDAEEAVQEAFARGLGLSGRRPPPDDPVAWLYRVASNVVRGRWRRALVAHRHRGELAMEVPVTSPADQADDRLMLLAALRGLPAAQRETLALRYLADLPIAAIADRMDVPVGTVKARLSRGRDALAVALTQDTALEGHPQFAPQPEFSAIRERGARRARRRIATAAAALAALATAGAVLGSGWLTAPQPLTPTPTPTPSVTTPLTYGQFADETLSLDSGGKLFLLRRECVSGCETSNPVQRVRLLRSADLGRNWTGAGTLPAAMAGERVLFLAGDELSLWIVGTRSMWSSVDAGKTWEHWPVADVGQSPEVSGGRLWVVAGDRVMTAVPGAAPKRASAGLPTGRVLRLVARTADSALALILPRIGDKTWGEPTWYGTDDAGQSWRKMPNPCAVTSNPDPRGTQLGVVAGGTVLWASCAGLGNPARGAELVVSTDSGKTWQTRQAMGNTESIIDILPFGEQVAWRYDGNTTIHRTEDGRIWTVVAEQPQGDARGFFAFDATTAVILEYRQLRVTTDGGRTWQTRPLPA